MSRREWPAWLRVQDIFDLVRLASPIAVSRASMMLMGLTDTIVLSRNAPSELPYVLNSWLPISIVLGLSIGLLLGVSILTAEMAGRGERANTGRIFRRGLWTSIIFGAGSTALVVVIARPLYIVLGFEGQNLEGTVSATRILAYGLAGHMIANAASSYLEALRKPTIATVTLYVGVLVNLLLDLAFVAGSWGFPALGADGVAMATSGTRWVLSVLLLVMVWRLTPGFKSSKPSEPGEGKRQIELGYGMSAASAAEWGSFNFTFVISSWVGMAANTTYGMVINTIGFVFMAFLGIGTATSVRVAEAIGSGNGGGALNASRLGVVTCILFGIFAGLLMYLFPGTIASVFVQRTAMVGGVVIHPLLAGLIALAALAVIFDGLQNVASMASRALGSVWVPTFIHIGCYVCIMLPLAYWLGIGLGFGADGVVWGVIIASFIAGVIQMAYLEILGRRRQKTDPLSEPGQLMSFEA